MLDKHCIEILRAVVEDLEDETLEDYDTGPHTTMADFIKVIDEVAVLVPLLGLLARGELTIEQFIRGIGASLPTFEVKATRVRSQPRWCEVVYHVQAASAVEARALVKSGEIVEFEESDMEDDIDTDETETIDSVEVFQGIPGEICPHGNSWMGGCAECDTAEVEYCDDERMRGDDETEESETIDSVEVLQERVTTGKWFLSRDFADMTDSPLSDGSAVVWICSDGCAARVPDRVVRTGGRTMDTAGIVCVVCGSVENESGGSDV